MSRRKQSAGQKIRKLRQADVLSGQGKTIEEICRELGVSDSTYYKWRREYGGMGIDQVRWLRELEKENNRLKRVVADQVLDIQILKDVSPGNFWAQGGVGLECSMHVTGMMCRSARRVVCRASTGLRFVMCESVRRTRLLCAGI